MDLPLFAKYLSIYHLFETRVCETQVCCVTRVLWQNSLQICYAIFLWNSSSINNFKNFSMELEFPISGRSIHISQTLVDCKIFSKTFVFGHFGRRKTDLGRYFSHQPMNIESSAYNYLTVTPISPLSQIKTDQKGWRGQLKRIKTRPNGPGKMGLTDPCPWAEKR